MPFRDRPLVASARHDWKMSLLIVLVFVTVGFVAFGTPAALSASNTGAKLARSSEITGCRSAANARVTDATTTLNKTRTQSDIIQDSFLLAVTNRSGDPVQLAKDLVTVTKQLKIDSNNLDRVNKRYQTAVTLSNDDPDAFLDWCKQMRQTSKAKK